MFNLKYRSLKIHFKIIASSFMQLILYFGSWQYWNEHICELKTPGVYFATFMKVGK